MSVEVRDVADGLWLWRQPHPDWSEGDDWEPEVASFAVESRGVAYLLDPLAPPPSASAVWDRLEARPPDGVIVLKPDHVRDVDLFVRWYGARAAGPWLFWAGDAPKTELEPIRPGFELPFEHVLVSHGEPVHDRAAFEAALERDPWSQSDTA